MALHNGNGRRKFMLGTFNIPFLFHIPVDKV